MGTLTAQSIVDKVEVTLQDSSNQTWLESEHLGSLNDGIEKICTLRLDANPVNASVQLVAGVKQSLPAGGAGLVDIIRNMGSGSTPGNAVTIVDRKEMNAALPGWSAATAAATVIHYMYDRKDPKTFYVYPPQPGTGMGYVEMLYGAIPAAIALGATIPIDDHFENAIMCFMLYKAWLKKQPTLASGYYGLFLADLGLSEEEKQKDDPNKNVGGGS